MASSSSLFLTRRPLSRLLLTSRRPIPSSQHVAKLQGVTLQCQQQRPTMVAFFSTSEAAKEEKPAIPGVGKYKTSTGLVGLAVEPNWYNILIDKHQALLDKMQASDMPETAQYRIDVTKWCNYTLKAVKANPDDPEAIEELCQMGQVEEMIEQAKDEMAVLDMYLEHRIWELVEKANPTVDYNPDPTVDPMGEDGDPDVADAIREGNK